MIIDFRYHVVTLVAVFLALGIGIIIGSALLGSEAIVQQQREMTDRLEAQLQEIRMENKTVQARINELEVDGTIQKQFEKQVLPVLVSGKLAEQNVVIIETNNYGMRDELLSTLEMAGAQVSSVTTLLNGLNPGAQGDELRSSLGLEEGDEGRITEQLARLIAEGIVTGDKQAAFNTLAQSDMIKNVGEYGVPLNAVIIIGGSHDESLVKTDVIDNVMISYFLDKGIPVFGLEDSNATISYMEEYQKFNISTVDNIDTVPGQLALVMAMSGKSGHYGVKPTAQRLLPTLE
ncbi:copper transporter, partial [Desulfofalx alkaliphila]|uniref:copper transporter n=1 Tax=Desulfofalx alkaliphila TaxID=105483 RepID=UPI0004E26DA8